MLERKVHFYSLLTRFFGVEPSLYSYCDTSTVIEKSLSSVCACLALLEPVMGKAAMMRLERPQPAPQFSLIAAAIM